MRSGEQKGAASQVCDRHCTVTMHGRFVYRRPIGRAADAPLTAEPRCRVRVSRACVESNGNRTPCNDGDKRRCSIFFVRVLAMHRGCWTAANAVAQRRCPFCCGYCTAVPHYSMYAYGYCTVLQRTPAGGALLPGPGGRAATVPLEFTFWYAASKW